jgi:hypothetical protein
MNKVWVGLGRRRGNNIIKRVTFTCNRGRPIPVQTGFDSVFGVGRPSEPIEVWPPPLFIRKKFFSLVVVGVCVPDAGSPLKCFFEKEREEKLRFSVAAAMMLQGAN